MTVSPKYPRKNRTEPIMNPVDRTKNGTRTVDLGNPDDAREILDAFDRALGSPSVDTGDLLGDLLMCER
jgi:hypothetical protein